MSTSGITGSVARGARRHATIALNPPWHWRPELLYAAVIALWVLAGLALVYRAPRPLAIDIGSSYASAHLRGFLAPQRNGATSYAFTGREAQIWVPGAGGRIFETTLHFNGWRRDGVEPARVSVGTSRSRVTLVAPGIPRDYHILVPASWGDLDVSIASNTFRAGADDPRQLGIPIEEFEAQAVKPSPPLRTGLMLVAIAIGLYALARRLAIRPDAAALLTLLVISAALYGLLNARLLITVGMLRWLVVVLGLHVVLWPLRPLVRTIYHRSAVPLSDGEEAWLWRIFAAATLVKLGGILYPHIIIFDEPAHVSRVQWILAGRFMELYRPGYTSHMGSTVGLGSGQFPYSPLWYLVVLPFHFLGLGLADASNGLSALMDISKLFPIHLIARVTIGSRRTALLAAALYHLIPMPYYMLSWGNYPTQFGLWAALLATAFLVVHYERFGSSRTFAAWVALLALAILSYTVLGMFAITFFGLIGLLGLLQRSRYGGKRLRFIVTGILVAELFCFAIYHVQFAQAMVSETLPAVVSGTVDRLDNPPDPNAEARENALANVKANNQFTVNHFTPLVLVLAGLGGLALALNERTRRWWPFWVAWIGVFLLYTLVSAYIADMVLKHVFFIMPLVCIFAALVLERWWRHNSFGRAAVLFVLLFLAAECIERWHYYLLIKRHFV